MVMATAFAGGGGGVMTRSTAAFVSAFPALLAVSLLLFSFRSAVHLATHHLTSLLDHDPAVLSLLSRLSSDNHHYHDHHHHHHRRQRPPFLHLTRVGTLDDDDFFSDNPDHFSDHHRSSSLLRHPHNSTLLIPPGRLLHLNLGFRKSPGPHKIRVPDPSASPILFLYPENSAADGNSDESEDRERDRDAVELRIFGQGFDLDRQEALLIVYLASLFSVIHLSAILGFLSCYSCAVGIVFFAVSSFLLGRQHRSFFRTLYSGSRLGIRRVTVFVFLRWSLRDALAQILSICFFSDVKVQHSFKLFVTVKLLPFSVTASPPLLQHPGGSDVADYLSGFLFMWSLLDMVIALVFTLNCWVAIMDHTERRSGREVVKEGFHLVSTMMGRAILIRVLEIVFCGYSGRWVGTVIAGPLGAAVFQAVAEVYFMVVWLMFYFEVRCRDGEVNNGRRFGWRDLEDCIDGLG